PLLEDLRQRGQSVRALWMRLFLERAPVNAQRLEPSVPTRDAQLLLELLRLRLTATTLSAPVERVVLEAEPTEAMAGQLNMFAAKRDLSAGDRALARLKASYGEEVVCRAELEDAHLPEAKFRWVGMERLELPHPERAPELTTPPLVRRLLLKPEPL